MVYGVPLAGVEILNHHLDRGWVAEPMCFNIDLLYVLCPQPPKPVVELEPRVGHSQHHRDEEQKSSEAKNLFEHIARSRGWAFGPLVAIAPGSANRDENA